ncbi:MAG: putative ABC transporter permease [Lachnospiraceae bacterium]|nr:putative ABC transporter permease [Lachnospiraceae bacterium]
MEVSQYFVEFIFYSFLGWVFESIYCSVKEKEWKDRGFLFGPICPIYGACVVTASLLFSQVKVLSDPDFPIWGIFLICMAGSAVAEFSTSWFLEKRFHARWWDYSDMPLNLHGRIALPVSVGFGIAGIAVVRYLIPFISGIHTGVPPMVYEVLALVMALLFGADFALTEAALSSLLKNVENYKAEFNRRAELAYNSISSAPKRLEEGVTGARDAVAGNIVAAKRTVSAGLANAREALADSAAQIIEQRDNSEQESMEKIHAFSDSYLNNMSESQKRILGNIRIFKPKEKENTFFGKSPTEHLKEALRMGRRLRRRKSGK